MEGKDDEERPKGEDREAKPFYNPSSIDTLRTLLNCYRTKEKNTLLLKYTKLSKSNAVFKRYIITRLMAK